jgi:hypothetical protein
MERIQVGRIFTPQDSRVEEVGARGREGESSSRLVVDGRRRGGKEACAEEGRGREDAEMI